MFSLAILLALAVGCSSDAKDTPTGPEDGGPHATDDSGIDCTTLVTVPPGEKILKSCIYEYPSGTTIARSDALGVYAVWPDGGVAASWMGCACSATYQPPPTVPSLTGLYYEVIPEGAEPTTWTPTASISIDGYDRSCRTDDDCEGVYAGNLQSACCPNAAIASSAVDQYYTDLNRLRGGGVFGDCACGIARYRFSCNQGLCTTTSLDRFEADAGTPTDAGT